MTDFIAPDKLPAGIKLDWEGKVGVDDGWDRINQITLGAGAAAGKECVGIIAVDHCLGGSDSDPILTAARETVLILSAMGMEGPAIAGSTGRGAYTVKTHKQKGEQDIRGPGITHLLTQHLFDVGLLVVRQRLIPAKQPDADCSKFLRLLSTQHSYKAVGRVWPNLIEAEIKNSVVSKAHRTGGLPPQLKNQAAYVFWWNVVQRLGTDAEEPAFN